MYSPSQHFEAREKCFPQNRKEEPYIHPLSKPSLTSISLDMCTEALCTESGAGIDPFSAPEPSGSRPRRQRAERASRGGKESFPPPLASCLRVHSHREGGRLVISASASRGRRLTAERGDGRLRLSLVIEGGRCEEESVKEEGGKVLLVRCNGERSGNERMHSFQFCVVGS
ncbi:hypothetical protein SASPL_103260 [Salvia splendens]|uniref:FAF domain-containing protein n=1 Tax=Salvia splendens TaxID=180675 RepID=A0A8X8YXE0_SALSN|nr:protein FANTASTIC FOUR 1-like [Salvia splendens]KAG6438322.1 hypothetical protein SASPL_103260 [Salvia splendens]